MGQTWSQVFPEWTREYSDNRWESANNSSEQDWSHAATRHLPILRQTSRRSGEAKLMSPLKTSATAALGIFLTADGLIGFRLWKTGWPKHINLTAVRPGVEEVHVLPISPTISDVVILALAIGLHVLLCYLAWKAWRSPRIHA